MVATYGLTRVALAVADAERPLAFYEQVLGLVAVCRQPVSSRRRRRVAGTCWCSRRTGAGGPGGGIAHFGFRLVDPADIDAAAAAVEQAGGTIRERGESYPGEPYLFFTGPDGYEVEIWHELSTPVDPPGSQHA
jgi:catechol 2,3-dioxygenase-like lactoylglutathione lyase family enzyme